MLQSAQWSPRQAHFLSDRNLHCSRYESYEEEEMLPTKNDFTEIMMYNGQEETPSVFSRFFRFFANRTPKTEQLSYS